MLKIGPSAATNFLFTAGKPAIAAVLVTSAGLTIPASSVWGWQTPTRESEAEIRTTLRFAIVTKQQSMSPTSVRVPQEFKSRNVIMMLPVDGSTVHKPPSLSYLHAPELAPSLAADAIRLLPIQGSKPATAITSARDSAALTSSAAASMTKLATASASPPTKSMSQGFTDRASNVPAALGIKDSSSGLVANVATESAITTLSTQFVPTHFDVNHKQTSPAEATAPYLMDVQTSDAGDAGDAPVAQIATSPVPKIGLAQKLSNSVASRDQSIIDTPRGISEVRKTSEGVTFAASVAVNGTTVGRLPLLIRDGQNISVRLSDVLETLKPMMDSDLHDSLTGSTASGEYVTLDDLRAAGVSAQFSDDDQLSLRLR